jgi:hypothetical protein
MLLGRYTGKRSLNQYKCSECVRVFLDVQGGFGWDGRVLKMLTLIIVIFYIFLFYNDVRS